MFCRWYVTILHLSKAPLVDHAIFRNSSSGVKTAKHGSAASTLASWWCKYIRCQVGHYVLATWLGGTVCSCLTLAHADGGGSMQPPWVFFWYSLRTAGRIALKFCIAYGASFAQQGTRFGRRFCDHPGRKFFPLFGSNEHRMDIFYAD